MPNDAGKAEPTIEPAWLTPDQAAAYLGCSSSKLYELRRNGLIVPSYLLGRQSPRYERCGLDNALRNAIPANTPALVG